MDLLISTQQFREVGKRKQGENLKQTLFAGDGLSPQSYLHPEHLYITKSKLNTSTPSVVMSEDVIVMTRM